MRKPKKGEIKKKKRETHKSAPPRLTYKGLQLTETHTSPEGASSRYSRQQCIMGYAKKAHWLDSDENGWRVHHLAIWLFGIADYDSHAVGTTTEDWLLSYRQERENIIVKHY